MSIEKLPRLRFAILGDKIVNDFQRPLQLNVKTAEEPKPHNIVATQKEFFMPFRFLPLFFTSSQKKSLNYMRMAYKTNA